MPVIIDGTTGVSLIQDNTVTTSKIVNGAVITADIADANVTGAKLENSGVTAGSYGSASAIPVVTVDAKGRVTSATTAALSGGGVTSLNGQTGAVTTTNIGSVGSVMMVFVNSTVDLGANSTVAGGNLYYSTTSTFAQNGSFFNGSWSTGAGSIIAYLAFAGQFFYQAYISGTGNPGFLIPNGQTALSGTWRLLTPVRQRYYSSSYCGYAGQTYYASYMFGALAVRVS